MASGEFTFYPSFDEYVTLYRGVIRVWIANEDETNPGQKGYLYAEYIDGTIQELGPVSDYETAKDYFAHLDPPIDLTYGQWADILYHTPDNAQASIASAAAAEESNKQSESWAVGTRGGQPDQEHATNNAKFWDEQSKIWATGRDLNNQVVQGANNATYWANNAHGWTNNGSGQADSFAADNNAKYWAEQSKEYTNGEDLSGNPVQARETDNAEYFKNQAKLWANNGAQGDSPGSSNNARYWAEQAKSYSDGKDLSDTTDLRPTDNAEYYKDEAKDWVGSTNEHASATDNAIYWKNQAKLWANNGSQGDTPGAENNSRYWAEQAKSYSDGKSLDDQTTIRGTDNAEYYKDEAKAWAGSDNEHASATDNAKYWKDQSKLWANFGSDGDAPTASNNAKEYARQSAASATAASTSETNAAQSATDAAASESAAAQSETNAATSASNAAQSETSAAASESAAAQSETNAATSETNAATSATNAATSETNAAASESAAAQSESNAAQSESNAAQSETNAAASEVNAAQSAINAAASEANAAQSESDAAQHESDAETAKNAAEAAQAKAETAMSHYPRIKSNDNWEVWNVAQEDWEDTGHKSIAEATTSYAYQNSESGTTVPTGTWTNSPQPQEGKYIWSRITYTWTNGSVDNFYNVTYVGVNGTGSVNSVNGKGGNVILDGKDIYVDRSLEVKETIYAAVERLGTRITEAEIDVLF